MFDLRDLARPIIGAPMAGGPSTPELAAAVSNAGGLGFLAAGYRTPAQMASQLEQARSLTTGPVGINLFVPDAYQPDLALLGEYRDRLIPEARRLGVEPGEPRADDDHWHAKLDMLADIRPDVVSFTFGCPGQDLLGFLAAHGTLSLVTVTNRIEAELALARGAGALAIQGPAAGGHRGTFDQREKPTQQPLAVTVAELAELTDVPLVAAGGITTADDVASVRSAGAVAAQIGTALLLADEAGTNPLHRTALTTGSFTATALTRAFTGRFARGLTNRFITEHPDAPTGYPHVHYLTAPIRGAAVARQDAAAAHLWAGTGFRGITGGPAAEIVRHLAG